jgi:hypothetical protein
MARIYNNIFHFKALQNILKLGLFGLKRNHLATLLEVINTTSAASKRTSNLQLLQFNGVPIWGHYFSTIFTNFRRFSPIFVNERRFSAIFGDFRRFRRLAAIFTNFRRFSPIFADFRRFSPIFADFRRFSPIFAGFSCYDPIYCLNT